jgi:Secretion system C-terminal sorting domain
MKQFFLVFLLAVICSFLTSAQVLKIHDTSLQPKDFVAPSVNTVPGGTIRDAGTLLTNGVLVTTFQNYASGASPMGVAFDGTYYYLISGGFSSNTVAQLDASFNLVTTQSVALDMRSIFYNSADGDVYVKDYSNNGLFRLHTNPFDGGYDVIFTGIFQDPQTKACLSADNSTMFDQLNGNARSYDFATGTVLSTFTLALQHDLTWPRGNILAYTGTYLLTYAHPVVYAYDVTNGSYVSSCNLGTQPSSDEWSISYTNGYFMVTDASDATWYVWTIDQGVPVELTSFTANVGNSEVVLNWATATETNNKGFEVQRKSENKDFEKIGFVAGFGTTTEHKSYSYTDSKVSAGNYTYRLKQTDFDGSFKYSKTIEVAVTNPDKFSLGQNYPNPFNPTTKISWQSPVSTLQILKVYDNLGRVVATLSNEYKPAGNYSVDFNASNLPSGVYYYKLTAGNFSSVKKMILLK